MDTFPIPDDKLKKTREFLKSELERDSGKTISGHLKENGIKSLFIVPIFRDYLGFEDVKHFSFEMSMGNASGASDILLSSQNASTDLRREDLLIETKQVGYWKLPYTGDIYQTDEFKQIKEYMIPERHSDQAILTDGITWFVFLKKSFIEAEGPKKEEIPSLKEKVILSLSFNIKDDHFWEYLLVFHKDQYRWNSSQLAKALVREVVTSQGAGIKLSNMFRIENSEIREKVGHEVKKQLEERFRPQLGNMDPAYREKKLHFDDEMLSFDVEVTENLMAKVIVDTISFKAKAFQEYTKLENFVDDWKKQPGVILYRSVGELIQGLKGAGQTRDAYCKKYLKLLP